MTDKTGQLGTLPRLLFKKEEAAEILAVTPATMNGLLRNDAVPRHIIQGKLRFTWSDLERIVDMCRQD